MQNLEKEVVSYTIKYSKQGIWQYHTVLIKNNILQKSKLRTAYRSDAPSLYKCVSVEDVLKVIKEYAFCNKAYLYLINNLPLRLNKNTLSSLIAESKTLQKEVSVKIFDKWFKLAKVTVKPSTLIIKKEELLVNGSTPIMNSKYYEDVNRLAYEVLYSIQKVKYFGFKDEYEPDFIRKILYLKN